MATKQQSQQFSLDGIAPISADPLTGQLRQVVLNKFIWNQTDKFILMQTEGQYIDKGSKLTSLRHPSYGVDLMANNEPRFVDRITGEFCADNDSNAIGEYDFFIMMANGNINIFSIMYDIIVKRDLEDKRYDI